MHDLMDSLHIDGMIVLTLVFKVLLSFNLEKGCPSSALSSGFKELCWHQEAVHESLQPCYLLLFMRCKIQKRDGAKNQPLVDYRCACSGFSERTIHYHVHIPSEGWDDSIWSKKSVTISAAYYQCSTPPLSLSPLCLYEIYCSRLQCDWKLDFNLTASPSLLCQELRSCSVLKKRSLSITGM